MQAKNSTTLDPTQAPLVTNAIGFHCRYREERSFFTVQAGIPAEDALNEAICFLAAGESIITKLMDTGIGVNDAVGIRILIEAARALVHSTTLSIEGGEA